METPLVSIVMPFKNTSTFINECIISIINQTYQNWELLAVNDGSTDNSLEILQSFSANDSRIKVFNTEGDGIIDALRLAYKNSSGSFITRMDSDDIMTPQKLKVMVNSLLKNGEGNIVLGHVNYFSKKGVGEGFTKYETWLNRLTTYGDNFKEIYKECVIPSPCWMVYRTDFEKCGAFNSDIYPEDYDLTFRFYENHLKCMPSNETLHLWRDYPTRTSRTHEHYADSSFIEIKLHYFLKLDYNTTQSLVVWGAGKKGKLVAKLLIKNEIPFYWICDNLKKIGKEIYNQKILSFTEMDKIKNPQSIITVANPKSQQEIKSYFRGINYLSMKDYFFFC
jgi:glycosyltransferase involved in cell wall biosynthesis